MWSKEEERNVRRVISGASYVLADDDARARARTRCSLEAYGARAILEVENGAQALSLLRRIRVDAVLAAWRMWPVDGLTMAFCLRRIGRTPDPHLPIIALSDDGDMASVVAARSLEVDAFLVRPMSSRGLCRRVAKAIVRAASASQAPSAPGAATGSRATGREAGGGALPSVAEARVLLARFRHGDADRISSDDSSA